MTPPRSPTLIRLKSWAIMVNDRLFPAVLRVKRSIRRLPRCNLRRQLPGSELVVARPSPRFRRPEPDLDVNLFTFSIAGVVLASICKVVRTLR
jgi:hypothetical protein